MSPKEFCERFINMGPRYNIKKDLVGMTRLTPVKATRIPPQALRLSQSRPIITHLFDARAECIHMRVGVLFHIKNFSMSPNGKYIKRFVLLQIVGLGWSGWLDETNQNVSMVGRYYIIHNQPVSVTQLKLTLKPGFIGNCVKSNSLNFIS